MFGEIGWVGEVPVDSASNPPAVGLPGATRTRLPQTHLTAALHFHSL